MDYLHLVGNQFQSPDHGGNIGAIKHERPQHRKSAEVLYLVARHERFESPVLQAII
jgi:hypothetical protein